jgi:hypothetical protein
LGCRNYRDIPHPEASQIGVREAAVHGGYSFSGRHPFTSHLEIRNCCDQALSQPIPKRDAHPDYLRDGDISTATRGVAGRTSQSLHLLKQKKFGARQETETKPPPQLMMNFMRGL